MTVYHNVSIIVFTQYLYRAFTAPDPIMQALRNEGAVHKVLVGGDQTQESLDKKNLIELLNTPEDGSGRLRACCIFSSKKDKSFKYTCSISRYSGKPSIRIDDVNQARFLGGGVNELRQQKAEKEFVEAKKSAEEHKNQLDAMQDEIDEKIRLHNEAKARCEATKTKLGALQSVRKKVERCRKKLEELEERASADNSGAKKKLLKQVMARMKNAITAIEAHAEGHQTLMQATFKTAGIRINDSIVQNEHRIVR